MDNTQCIAMAAVQASYSVKAAAIVTLTTSGATAKMCAKYHPRCPIVAVTRFDQVARQLQLHRGVLPLYYTGKIKSQLFFRESKYSQNST